MTSNYKNFTPRDILIAQTEKIWNLKRVWIICVNVYMKMYLRLWCHDQKGTWWLNHTGPAVVKAKHMLNTIKLSWKRSYYLRLWLTDSLLKSSTITEGDKIKREEHECSAHRLYRETSNFQPHSGSIRFTLEKTKAQKHNLCKSKLFLSEFGLSNTFVYDTRQLMGRTNQTAWDAFKEMGKAWRGHAKIYK